MNIAGKVLIILNLVFALATGGFMAVDFVTRTYWKTRGEGLQRELDVARANNSATKRTFEELDRQAKNALRALELERQSRKNDEIVRKIQMDDAVRKADDETAKTREGDLRGQKLGGEVQRLRDEVKALTTTVDERNKALAAREQEVREIKLDMIANREKAEATIGRNQDLLEQLAEARRKLGELESGSAPAAVSTADPNRPNPPSAQVRGIVEKVDPKDGLVEISIGADRGLKTYHTLEVYRLQPQPQYLGRIRVVDVFEHKAIGRLVRMPLTAARPLHEGDHIANSLGTP